MFNAQHMGWLIIERSSINYILTDAKTVADAKHSSVNIYHEPICMAGCAAASVSDIQAAVPYKTPQHLFSTKQQSPASPVHIVTELVPY